MIMCAVVLVVFGGLLSWMSHVVARAESHSDDDIAGWMWLAGQAVVVIGFVLGLIWIFSPEAPPTREEAENGIVQIADKQGYPGTVAVCTEPTSDGWTCRLRDDALDYGFASGSVASGGDVHWNYDFSVTSNGVASKDVDVGGLYTVGDEVNLLADQAMQATGRSGAPRLDCSSGAEGPSIVAPNFGGQMGLNVGETRFCTGAAPITHGTIERQSATHYRITLSVDLP